MRVSIDCIYHRSLSLQRIAFHSRIRYQSTTIGSTSNSHGDGNASPTPLNMGFQLKFHPAVHDDHDGNLTHHKPRRPLAVLAGWLGANERQMKPYLSFYHKRGIDTLSFAVGPKHILFPKKAMEQMEMVLHSIHDPWSRHREKNGAIGHPIPPVNTLIFHHFSVGGFLYGQLLRALADDPKHHNVRDAIKAQIFDSPPDIQGIPYGISRGIGAPPMFQNAIEVTLRSYLSFTDRSTGPEYRASSSAFHNNFLTKTPALWYYSKSDIIADWKACDTVISKWKKSGMPVTECVWEDTPHIQHARVDPDRYFGTLHSFLATHNVIASQ